MVNYIVIRKACLLLSALMFSGLLYAEEPDEIYCEGFITDWDVTRAGSLYIDGDWNGSEASQRMCTLQGSFDDVSTDVCKAWLSSVAAATIAKSKA